MMGGFNVLMDMTKIIYK